MSKYILKTMNSIDEMEAVLKENICFPLVREIEFKYGLKVYKISGENKAKSTPHFFLCYSNGMPCAEVWATKNQEWDANKGTHVEYSEFHFKTPYYQKARASSDSDRQTVSSRKISTLMGTIQRQKIIKPVEKIFSDAYKDDFKNAREIMKNAFGKSNKYESVSMDTIHALVAHALGESPHRYGLSLDLNLCKILLDKFNKADSIKTEREEEAHRFFSNPFYAIGVDKNNHYLIGKFKLVGDQVAIVEDFNRVQSLDHKEDLSSILIMIKISNEGKQNIDRNGFLNCDTYDANLDVLYKQAWYRDDTDLVWTFIPCP